MYLYMDPITAVEIRSYLCSHWNPSHWFYQTLDGKEDLKTTILPTFPSYTQTAEFKDSFTKSSLNYLPCSSHLPSDGRWPCKCWHSNSLDRLFLAAENMWKGLQMLLWSAILEHRTCFQKATSQGTQLKIKATNISERNCWSKLLDCSARITV